MKPFCEIIVREVLPATRAMVAVRLSEKGLSGKEVAERMGLTPAAVTQYLHKARGGKSLENKAVEERIDLLAEKLLKNELGEREKITEFCELCRLVREQRLICEVHREAAGLERCDVCFQCP